MTKRRAWPVSLVFLKDFLRKSRFWKTSADDKNMQKSQYAKSWMSHQYEPLSRFFFQLIFLNIYKQFLLLSIFKPSKTEKVQNSLDMHYVIVRCILTV